MPRRRGSVDPVTLDSIHCKSAISALLEIFILGLPAFLTLSLLWNKRLLPLLAVESRWTPVETQKAQARAKTLPEPAKVRPPPRAGLQH